MLSEQRYDNALYLAGYVAECALKAVIACCEGDPKTFGHGLTRLRGEGLELAFVVSPASTRYRPPEKAVADLGSRWSTHLRYERSHVTENAARDAVARAEEVWTATAGQMYLDGLIADWVDA